MNSSLISQASLSWFLPVVVTFVYIVDQVSKYFIVLHMDELQSIEIIPNLFNFTFIYNTGIAFGLFRGGSWILVGVILIGISMLIYLAYKIRNEPLIFQLGISFIIGGAFGNLTDRFFRGAVVDFIDFRVWPVFNLADSFITVGVIILSFALLKQKK